MDDFVLDSRLVNDCKVMGRLDLSHLLLMNNSLLPWFILVPESSKSEIIELSPSEQTRLLKEINLISLFTKENFDVKKLNVAAIGNIVNQLHVHIVGRKPSDFCWPNVVWGTTEKKSYSDAQVSNISTMLQDQLGEQFSASS